MIETVLKLIANDRIVVVNKLDGSFRRVMFKHSQRAIRTVIAPMYASHPFRAEHRDLP
jgi:hypothetical protein